MTGVAEAVAQEVGKGEMALIRNESGVEKDKPLPLLYCSELIDKPAVRGAISKAVAKLGPAYAQ